ncbi:hypothetical protein F5B17DRAFT_431686 [Nemania serpens]|nr:hypothetical protein F5B17DRAFT_431686 [Nemania serpens]
MDQQQVAENQNAKIDDALKTLNTRFHDCIRKRYHGCRPPFWHIWFWIIFIRILIFIIVIIVIYLPVPNSRDETYYIGDFERLAGSAEELKEEEIQESRK